MNWKVKTYRLCFLVASLVAFLPWGAHCQDVRASAMVDSNNILIGQQFKVAVEVKHTSGVSVLWPSFVDSLPGLELINHTEPEAKTSGDTVTESANLTVTSFDSGTAVIPAIQFAYTLKGDTLRHFVLTSPIPIFVHTVAVDTSKPAKDIKPPEGVPITFMELLPYLLGAAAIGLIIWLILYIIKRRTMGEPIIPEVPRRPAFEVAFEALRSLESEKLWQRGLVKEYHSQLSDILRAFIERRFTIMAMEMTTDEIMATEAIGALPKALKASLKEILVLADFAKFAKARPEPQENEVSMKSAYAFLEQSRHYEVLQAQSAAEQTVPPAGEPAKEPIA
jgi:hypothetical protein